MLKKARSRSFWLTAVSGTILLVYCPRESLAEDLQKKAVERRVITERTVSDEDIHFLSGSFALSQNARSALQNKAAWLRLRPVTVVIEGHCDERGVRAYNLVLGYRRAEAVKSYMILLGISASRLKTVSCGEERPLVADPDEKAYSRNRRVHFEIIEDVFDDRSAMPAVEGGLPAED